MEKRSWMVTVITQLSLCVLLYIALNLGGHPPPQSHSTSIRSRFDTPLHFYFISVQGGGLTPTPTPFPHQSRLLNLMGKVRETYNLKFVLNIAELGEDDPLLHNGTTNSKLLGVPWYTTTASKEKPVDFVKQIKLPLGKTLGIIAMNTGILQDSPNRSKNDQLQRLARTLESADSHWRIVIGLHPLDGCKRSKEHLNVKHTYKLLHKIFVKYGVNAYLSRRGCTDYRLRDGIAYIGLPDPVEKQPYILENGSVTFKESSGEVGDGFLLHRISSLELETYFVTLNGTVSHKFAFQQRGVEAV